jgi:hypothetical protein
MENFSEIYREAAKLVATEYFNKEGKEHYACCTAIKTMLRSTISDNPKIEALFSDYFKPRNFLSSEPWFGSTRKGKNRNMRVLALLFMYEIVKDEKTL